MASVRDSAPPTSVPAPRVKGCGRAYLGRGGCTFCRGAMDTLVQLGSRGTIQLGGGRGAYYYIFWGDLRQRSQI